MHHRLKKISNLLVIMFIVSFQSSEANTLKLTITPEQDLHAGRINDGAELATIYLSGMSESCVLNVWIEPPGKEIMPGHYILTDRKKGGGELNVRLSGDNWKPDTQAGKGVLSKFTSRFATLNVVSNGDQFIESHISSMQISAQCRNK